MLLKATIAGTLRPESLITHRFPMSQMLEAYDVFAHASRDGTLKVSIAAD